MSLPAGGSGLAEFAPPLGEDGLRPAFHLVNRGDVAEDAMQPDRVVVLNIMPANLLQFPTLTVGLPL